MRKWILLAAVLFSLTCPVHAYTVSQTKTNNTASGTSFAITVTSTTATHFLIVAVYSNVNTSNTLSITDSASSTWLAATANNTSSNLSQLFYLPNCASGVTSVTVHATASGAMVAIFREYSISPNITALDVQHSALSSANPATSGATGTLASANDLVIGVGSCERSGPNTFSLGAGYSNFSTNTVNFGGGGFTGDIMIEDKAPGSTSAQTATFGNSNGASTLVYCIAFEPSATVISPNYVISY